MKYVLRSLLAALTLVVMMLACSSLPVPIRLDQVTTATPQDSSTAEPSVTPRPLPEGMPTVETDFKKMLAVLQGGKFGFFEQFAVEKYNAADFAKPGSESFTVTFPSSETIFFNYGWCAKDLDTLNQNLKHIDLTPFFNNKEIPKEYIKGVDSTTKDGWECANGGMLLSNWTPGNYRFKFVATFDEKINDGGADYDAGDYIMDYDVTVK